jgi:hypothetical protein
MEYHTISQDQINKYIDVIERLKPVLNTTLNHLKEVLQFERKYSVNNPYQQSLSLSLMGGFTQNRLKSQKLNGNGKDNSQLSSCMEKMSILIKENSVDNLNDYIFWYCEQLTQSLTELNQFINDLDARYKSLSNPQLTVVSKSIDALGDDMFSIEKITV